MALLTLKRASDLLHAVEEIFLAVDRGRARAKRFGRRAANMAAVAEYSVVYRHRYRAGVGPIPASLMASRAPANLGYVLHAILPSSAHATTTVLRLVGRLYANLSSGGWS